MVKTLAEFWCEISQDVWSVQDFSVKPDQTADLARVYSFWHRHLIWAHMTELRMKGTWTIHLRSNKGHEARYERHYKYAGRGAHRDACLGSLTLERVTHLGLVVANDDLLPEKLNI